MSDARERQERMWERQAQRASLADEWWRMVGGRSGTRVADVGCGPGFFALRYAELAGPDGHVLAVDADPEAIALLEEKRDPERHGNVATLVLDAQAEAPDLSGTDTVFVANVLHHVEDPARVLRNLRDATGLGALILVAEFDPEGPGEIGPALERRVTPSAVTAWLWESGWRPQRVEGEPFEHYAVLAR